MRLLVSLLAALLLAPLGASAQVIHACVKNGGSLKIVADPAQCGQGDTPLSWNVQGPPGEPGTPGEDFMDPWTFHMKNAMKCCLNLLTPDGRLIPFCTYNSVGYREQIVQGLVQSKRTISKPG